MNHVERFEKLMAFKAVDRLPFIEFAEWWDKTLARWRGEGLSTELDDPGDIREQCFGLDRWRQLWISPFAPSCPDPPSFGAPLVRNDDDYEAIKAHLFPEPPFEKDKVHTWADPHDSGDMVVWITLEGFFWFPRTLFGIEGHLYAFHDHPELMHRMNQDLLEYNLAALEAFCGLLTPNFMTFAEDMSYRQGPMISKGAFDEFLAPYYRRIVPELKGRGVLPMVDSDGDVTAMIPWLIEAGIEGLLPLERQAGVDVAQIRRDHPEFRLIGAFNKTVMNQGEDAMRVEFERLLPVMQQGGFIPCVDHQTPPEVSLDQYRCYLSLLKQVL